MSSIHATAGGSGRLLDSYRRNSDGVQQAVERLSTGKRINRPSDDPAGFVAAEELRGELIDLRAELKVIGSSRNRAHAKESNLSRLQEQLIALRGVISGVAGNLLTDAEREAYGQEIAAGLDAIARIRAKLAELDPAAAESLASLASPWTGSLETADIRVAAVAVDAQLDQVSWSRAGLAAYEKYQLAIHQQILEDSVITHTAALSEIEDADFAEEAANLARSQTLVQSSLAALALSQNLAADQVLELVEDLNADAPSKD